MEKTIKHYAANLVAWLKSLKKREWITTVVLLVVLVIVANMIYGGVMGRVYANEEQSLFEKYSKDPQWKQVVDMLNKDRQDLATGNLEKARRVGVTMDMGLQWYNLREFKLAARWWERGLEIESNNFIGWYNLGNAYRELKKYSKAEDAYDSAMDIAKVGETDACLALGEMYKYDYIEEKDEEGDVYLECLKKHKDNRDLVARLAIYYRDSGDVKNALIYFEKLFAMDPESSIEIGEEIRKLQTTGQNQDQR